MNMSIDTFELCREKIGIISYKSLFLADEINVTEELNLQLRKIGLSPRTVFVSSLKDQNVQKKLINIFKKEDIRLIITTTSFSSSSLGINDISDNEKVMGYPAIPLKEFVKQRKK